MWTIPERFPARAPQRPRRESGSAYLITLLSLVVLTMLALALTFVTQTENLVGSNERTLQRVFYGAESGIHLAVARALANHEKCGQCNAFEDVPHPSPGSLLTAFIENDTIEPIDTPYCNLCSVNDALQYDGSAFYKVNHAITARASLVYGGEVAAQKTVSNMVDVLPWKDFKPATETCLLATVKCDEQRASAFR